MMMYRFCLDLIKEMEVEENDLTRNEWTSWKSHYSH